MALPGRSPVLAIGGQTTDMRGMGKGLIRQYLPKGTDPSPFSQDELNEIAERLNNRPRKVPGFLTPNEVFARLVAEAQVTAQQCCASG